jgi:(1->4)-alpha-D-glucan 1-alpha-D-glucosylmutase
MHFCERIEQYMQKALREAKRHTSWMSPSDEYETAVATFVQRLLLEKKGEALRTDLAAFAGQIATAGYFNGLAQLVLKAMLPGVPDFYQGSEYWDFNLVDPDNRRPVEFDQRRGSLAELQRRFAESPAELAATLAHDLPDNRTKQFVTWRALATRTAHAAVATKGSYVPLAVTGELAAHAFAFAREFQGAWIAAVVPRQIQCLLDDAGRVRWDDAIVELPPDVVAWRNEFTGEAVGSDGRVAKLFEQFPVTLLTGQSSEIS